MSEQDETKPCILTVQVPNAAPIKLKMAGCVCNVLDSYMTDGLGPFPQFGLPNARQLTLEEKLQVLDIVRITLERKTES